jgi:uncharacterized membrane protein YphA (DoxX/SURF4 family)
MMTTDGKNEKCMDFWSWFLSNHSCEPWVRWSLFLLRISVGLMFAMAGWAKLMNFDRAVRAASTAGFAAPQFFGACLVAVELAGGILLVLGVFVRPVAIVEGFVMVVAVVTFWEKGFSQVYGNFMVIAICAALFLGGGGPLSLRPGAHGKSDEDHEDRPPSPAEEARQDQQ